MCVCVCADLLMEVRGPPLRLQDARTPNTHTVHTASCCACTAHTQPRTLRNIATRFAATLRHAASSCFTLCHDMLCQATSRRHVSGRLRRRLPYGRRQVDMVREGRGRQSQHQQSVFPFEGSTIAASVRSIYVHLQCGCSRASVAHVVSGGAAVPVPAIHVGGAGRGPVQDRIKNVTYKCTEVCSWQRHSPCRCFIRLRVR